MQYLIYIVPVLAVAVIFFVGLAVSRRRLAEAASAPVPAPAPNPDLPRVYEEPGIRQRSDHPLGAVQRVIRGRIRFVGFGLILCGVASFGLFAIHVGTSGTDVMDAFGGRKPLNVLIATVLLASAILWGLRLMSYAVCRIRLRRTGFEISGVFGTRAYAYRDVTFHLSETIEHKYDSDGYRPVLMKTRSFNWIWVCQVLFWDGRKPIILKSSRYAWLQPKMRTLMNALDRPAGGSAS